ncbi:MAG: hypothetical protein RQ756_01645, partial [Flavobacteriaceae bacterium]|nr:hypothetical protein [Flavobacteriaceae bacterium]
MYFCTMSKPLNAEELHQLAMNVVGEHLQDEGYDFLGVNSKLKKDPQFVALKNKKLHFVVVRAVTYPNNPADYDQEKIRRIKDHAQNFNAITFYAGVGIGNKQDLEAPVVLSKEYIINFKGLTRIE